MDKLCVTGGGDGRRRRRTGGGGRDAEPKQEPHTKMWGKDR